LNSSYPRLWTPMHPQPLLPGLRWPEPTSQDA
jgi:hypothetical protein